jgi:hypothetical protein
LEYHVVSMRTEPPSLCLGCGRAACEGCVTLGVDRRRQAVLVLTPVVAVVASNLLEEREKD